MLREKIRATSALNAQDCGRNEGESHPGSGVEHSGPLRIDPSEDIQISVMLNKATRIGAHRAELGLKPGTHVGRDLVQCGFMIRTPHAIKRRTSSDPVVEALSSPCSHPFLSPLRAGAPPAFARGAQGRLLVRAEVGE
jgi:hypothetical protein